MHISQKGKMRCAVVLVLALWTSLGLRAEEAATVADATFTADSVSDARGQDSAENGGIRIRKEDHHSGKSGDWDVAWENEVDLDRSPSSADAFLSSLLPLYSQPSFKEEGLYERSMRSHGQGSEPAKGVGAKNGADTTDEEQEETTNTSAADNENDSDVQNESDSNDSEDTSSTKLAIQEEQEEGEEEEEEEEQQQQQQEGENADEEMGNADENGDVTPVDSADDDIEDSPSDEEMENENEDQDEGVTPVDSAEDDGDDEAEGSASPEPSSSKKPKKSKITPPRHSPSSSASPVPSHATSSKAQSGKAGSKSGNKKPNPTDKKHNDAISTTTSTITASPAIGGGGHGSKHGEDSLTHKLIKNKNKPAPVNLVISPSVPVTRLKGIHAVGPRISASPSSTYLRHISASPNSPTPTPSGTNRTLNGTNAMDQNVTQSANITTILGNGTVVPADGAVVLSNGTVVLGNGTAISTNETVILSNGTVIWGNGTISSSSMNNTASGTVEVEDDDFDSDEPFCATNQIILWSSDMERVKNCRFIVGNLLIAPAPFDTEKGGFVLDLPKLRAIGESLIISGPTSAKSIHMPRLQRIGAFLIMKRGILTELSFPALKEVSGIEILENSVLANVTMDLITQVNGGIHVDDNVHLKYLSMRSLMYLEDGFLLSNAEIQQLELPSLVDAVGGLQLDTLPSLTSLHLPKLSSVTFPEDLEGELAGSSVSGDTPGANGLYVTNVHRLVTLEVPSLKYVSGPFYVGGASVIESIDASSLVFVGGSLTIENVPKVEDLDFGSLSDVTHSVIVHQNPGLVSLKLASLGYVGFFLQVADCANLVNISIPQLATVAGHVDISNNPVLVSMDLHSLQFVTGDVRIRENSLTHVSMPSLKSIEGDGVVSQQSTFTCDSKLISMKDDGVAKKGWELHGHNCSAPIKKEDIKSAAFSFSATAAVGIFSSWSWLHVCLFVSFFYLR